MKVGTIVDLPAGKDVFILMVRYGYSSWSALTSRDSAEEAAQAMNHATGVTAWEVVKVTLPVTYGEQAA